jgi:hypothetical protein
MASAAVTDVELVMGTGELSLAPGAMGLAGGVIRCNVEDWLPEIARSDARLIIKQKSRDEVSGSVQSTINTWDLQLGESPMRLKIVAGAYESVLDLSGLTLQDLSIEEGASFAQVRFTSPNPGRMERLRYKTGTSTVSLLGLAHANFRSMELVAGSGMFDLDFSGRLRTKPTAKIEIGSGSIRIEVPQETAAVVKVKAGDTAVVTQGEWVTKGTTHSTPAFDTAEDDKILTIELEMGSGVATHVTE